MARSPRRRPTGLLAVACAISGVSGFFDGQFARDDLGKSLVAFQWLFVVSTLAVGGVAAATALRFARHRS